MATQDVIPKNVWNSGKLQLTFASKKISNEENLLEAKISIDCKDENAYKQMRQNKQNKHNSQEKEKNSIVSKSLDNQSNKFINKIHKKNSNRKSYDGFPRNNNNNNNYNKPPNSKFSFLISNQDEMICHERVATAIQLQRVLRVNPIEELYCVYITSDSLLTKHAHEYMNTLELTKQQATANWLKDKSEREKELYLQRNRMIL